MQSPKVLFVCQHGGAKSVIAAALLQRLARDLNIPVVCGAAGVQPYDSIPDNVRGALAAEGLPLDKETPESVSRAAVASATHVVSFGCDLSDFGASNVRRWDDVPAVSDGYSAAREAILLRLQGFLAELQRQSNAT